MTNKVFWLTGWIGDFQYGEIVGFTESFLTGTKAIIKVTESQNKKYTIGSFISIGIGQIQSQT